MEKSLGQVTFGRDVGESLMRRLSKQVRELQETVNVFQEASECKDPEPAHSEGTGQTLTGFVSRATTSLKRNLLAAIFANSSSRDVLLNRQFLVPPK